MEVLYRRALQKYLFAVPNKLEEFQQDTLLTENIPSVTPSSETSHGSVNISMVESDKKLFYQIIQFFFFFRLLPINKLLKI